MKFHLNNMKCCC